MSTLRGKTPTRPHRSGETLWLPSWPLRDEGWRTWGSAMVTLIVLLTFGVLAGHVLMALLTIVALAIVFWRLLLPVSFEIGPGGVAMIVLGRRHITPWRGIGRYEIRKSGVLLLPEADAVAADALRGVFIPFPPQREKLLKILSRYGVGSRVVERL